MINPPVTLLLVEAETLDATRIREVLVEVGQPVFHIESVKRCAEALSSLARGAVDVILLDLALPDVRGLEVLERVRAVAPDALILVLSAAIDEAMARSTVRRGADDYFIKDHVDAHWLPRSLGYLLGRKAARDALRRSEARFRAMSDALPLGIFVSDQHGACVYTNAAYQRIVGLDFEHTLGSDWLSHVHPDDRQHALAARGVAAEGPTPYLSEVRFVLGDGGVLWVRLHAAAIDDGPGSPGHVLTVEDISARKAADVVMCMAEEALFAEKERAQVTLDSIGDAVLATDVAGNVTYLNLVAETMTGWARGDAMGRPLSDVFHILDSTSREMVENPARLAMSEDRIVGLASGCVLLRRDGAESSIEDSAAPIHNREGQVTGAVIVFHDASESRAMAARMVHLAHHDFLTGLPNRALLTERLSQAIGLARRSGKQVALLFLDLDYFKHINDSLGHAIGDLLLQAVAERLVVCVRTTDTVCRRGGDEFVILLSEIEQIQDAARVADKLLQVFSQPQRIGGHELHVTFSIGISVYPDDGGSADAVLQNADTAMYYAKATGRNNYQFFQADMSTRAVRRLCVESGLRRALTQGEFLLYYQPQIDLASGAMTGAEALIRWQHPQLGIVLPEVFVPIAEESGLIVPIGRWVLREACCQLRMWQEAGLAVVPVSVNISAAEFCHKDFLAGVALILAETGLAPRLLELELTESILMQDTTSSTRLLTALRGMGMKLAIDDFGTGYSSLSYLKRFPVDTLKIDQSFVRDVVGDVVGDVDDASIVGAVIDMGRRLKQRVIAEGIETPAQFDFLLRQHCDEGQGFYLGRPMSSEAFGRLLAAG